MEYHDLDQLLESIIGLKGNGREWELAKKQLFNLQKNTQQKIDALQERVNEEQRISRKAREKLNNYEQILDCIPYIVLEATPEGKTRFINRRLEDYTGVDYEIFLKSWRYYFHPDDIDMLQQQWNFFTTQENFFKINLRIKNKDHQFKWFRLEVTPLKDSLQKVVKWIATATEIDSEKNLMQDLLESEQQFRFMAEFVPQIVWTALADGFEDFHNRRFEEYTGINLVEAKGFGWQVIIHPEDLECTLNTWKNSLETGQPYETEYRFKRFDGEYRWFLGRALPVKNENGTIIKWFGTCTDIHNEKLTRIELKNTLDELQKSNSQLNHVNDILNNFVYIAAHDLRSPVTNLQMIFDLLIEEKENNKKEEYIRLVNKSIQRLSSTINSLVEVIDIESIQKNVKVFSFEKVLELITAELSSVTPDITGFIHADFHTCPTISYVGAYLESIIKNLVTNAVKYKSRKRPLRIDITTKKEDDYIVLTIKDNGVGFDFERNKDKIFKPFKRLTHEGEGKGVGLFLVRNIVEKNGGKVEVDSQEDVGTKFNLYIKEYKS